VADLPADQIPFVSLEDKEFDSPLGLTTGAGALFGATGGVMEAALRTTYEVMTGKQLPKVELTAVRGYSAVRYVLS
jgi:NADH-quinone oxidoreductase subunit G